MRMLSNVEHWLVSAAVVIALLVVLVACICGCRKKVPKNELLGLAGMVKITNPEENIDQNYRQENGTSVITDNNRISVDAAEAHKRTSAATTANRSLPDIPVDPERVQLGGADTVWEANEPNSDTCSALYATVAENKHAASLLGPGGEMAAAGLPGEPPAPGAAASDDGKSSEYSSIGQNDDGFSPYAQLKGEHPYDRLRKSEHPYAQVGAGPSRPRSSAPAGYVSPVPPPRQRKSSSFHAELPAAAASGDIAAATAIAGHVSANQDLPYMTPPMPAAGADTQPHFSGDSQDSSKGYTSISVREPLANIKAQIQQQKQRRQVLDDVYTTVSDDSEEVYADIEDGQAVYTSGSETYAQIQPLSVAAPAEAAEDGAPPPPPQPPSVDSLKHVAQVHSRQASSSSAASSVANLGSPKPEKRQANSPLPPPPPPAASPELYATVDKKANREAAAAASAERSLEEMYAKVMKRTQRATAAPKLEAEPNAAPRLSAGSRAHSTESEPTSDDRPAGDDGSDLDSSRESVATARADIDRESLCSVDSEMQPGGEADKSDDGRHPYQPLAAGDVRPPADARSSDSVKSAAYADPGYEVVHRPSGPSLSDSDPNYEVVQRPGKPSLSDSDPNYEVVQQPNGPAMSDSDPNYEVVHRPSGPSMSDSDPNYEELRPQTSERKRPEKAAASKASAGSERDATAEPGYASIGYGGPGYEKVRSKSLEPSYAKIDKKRRSTSSATEEPNYASIRHANDDASSTFGSEADPNYETVMNVRPDYESIDYSNIPNDPPYERLTNSRDSITDVSPGFPGSGTTNREKRQSSSTETDYEEVSVQRTSDSRDVWETGRHKLI